MAPLHLLATLLVAAHLAPRAALGQECSEEGCCDSSPCANGATCTDSAVESEVSFHSVSRAAAAFPAAQRRAVESRWHIVNERVAGI